MPVILMIGLGPAASPAPGTPTPQIACTLADVVNVRKQPSSQGEVVAQLRIGTQVERSGANEEWTRITVGRGRGAVSGWIKSDLLSSECPTLESSLQRAEQTSDPAERQTWLERAFALDPHVPEVGERLSTLYRNAKDEDRAATVMRIAQRRSTTLLAMCRVGLKPHDPTAILVAEVACAAGSNPVPEGFLPFSQPDPKSWMARAMTERWYADGKPISGTPFPHPVVRKSYSSVPLIELGPCQPGVLLATAPWIRVNGAAEPADAAQLEAKRWAGFDAVWMSTHHAGFREVLFTHPEQRWAVFSVSNGSRTGAWSWVGVGTPVVRHHGWTVLQAHQPVLLAMATMGRDYGGKELEEMFTLVPLESSTLTRVVTTVLEDVMEAGPPVRGSKLIGRLHGSYSTGSGCEGQHETLGRILESAVVVDEFPDNLFMNIQGRDVMLARMPTRRAGERETWEAPGITVEMKEVLRDNCAFPDREDCVSSEGRFHVFVTAGHQRGELSGTLQCSD